MRQPAKSQATSQANEPTPSKHAQKYHGLHANLQLFA
jgi:hypothetical protein